MRSSNESVMKTMEKTSDFKGISEDYEQVTASADLKEELGAHLTFSMHQDAHFTSTAAQYLNTQEKDSDYNNTFLLGLFGTAFGAVCGGLTGGVGGAVGAAAAVTYSMFIGDFTAGGAALSFVGGIIAGAVGGAFGGTFGGAVGAAAAKETISPGFIRLVSDVSLVTIGCATGGAIGCSFHKTVCTVCGAAGAAFGALVARDMAAGFTGFFSDHLKRHRDSVEPIQTLLLGVLKKQQDKKKKLLKKGRRSQELENC